MNQSIYTVRSIIVRSMFVLLGTLIAAYGCGCYITAALGSDPVTAFVMGLSMSTNIQFGTMMNIFNGICFIIVLIWDRKRINIGTVLYTFTLGTFCDLFIFLLSPVAGSSIVIRVTLIIIGTIAIGFGLGLYQAAKFGAGPSDALNQIVSEKFKIPLKWERMGFDIIMVIGALILGGAMRFEIVYFGTIVGMFAVGPIMAPTMTKMENPISKLATK
ncbi:YitT family protein [Lachnospiraceae bacterium OttesenSCG-928-D06]|nr:YitT family protein [Lachnospiraceae bacterium OttesenSCG-928-D06]